MTLIPTNQSGYRQRTAVAASAFSKGNPLMYNDSSQLSRVPDDWAAGLVVGVALSDSDESIDSQVPYAEVTKDMEFFADTVEASTFTRGQKVYLDHVSGEYLVESSGTGVFVITQGTADVQFPSGVTRVIGKFDSTYLISD